MIHSHLPERRAGIVLAGHTGDRSKAMSGLDDPDAEIRCAALGALDRMDELDPGDLQRALADPEPAVRSRAARIAGRAQVCGAQLIELLTDPEDTVVEVAAFALGELESVPTGTVEALSSVAVSHTDSLCRESATAALGAIGASSGLPAVLHACKDKATVRRRAVLALAAFEGDDVDAMLRSMINDRDLQVRQAAEELLAIEEGESV